jgi:hypothetical protein
MSPGYRRSPDPLHRPGWGWPSLHAVGRAADNPCGGGYGQASAVEHSREIDRDQQLHTQQAGKLQRDEGAGFSLLET